MAKEHEEAIDLSIDFWQPCYSQTLTPEDAREIVENITGFFGVLAEWDRTLQEDNRLTGQEPKEKEREVSTRGDLVSDSVFGG
jgi:hypothetical protein